MRRSARCLVSVGATLAAMACSGGGETTAPPPPPPPPPPQVAVVVGPTGTRINTGESRLFVAVVTGTSDKALTWTASGGTIAGAGDTVTWTAPTSGATVTIRAASVADPSKSGSATITVDDPSAGAVRGDVLLSDAHASGAIDFSTYVLYQVYWAFGDPRLPAQYRGAGAGPGDLPDVLVNRPDGLSAAVKAELDRFAMPPNAPGSWYEVRNRPGASATRGVSDPEIPNVLEWQFVARPGGKVKVWWDKAYPGHKAKAELVAQQAEVVWQQFATLLGREPLSDAAQPAGMNGGDGRLDIYLTGMLFGDELYGLAIPFGERTGLTRPCVALPAFLVMNARLDNTFLLATTAHELFHAFQDAFTSVDTCGEFLKLMEATASWSQDYVSPADNTEWDFNDFFVRYNRPILQWNERGYAGFLYFEYLARTHSPAVIATLFNAVATQSVYEAINAASPGGLAQSLGDFAVAAWNQAPFDRFHQWDGKRDTPRPRGLSGPTPSSAPAPIAISLTPNQVEASWFSNQTGLAGSGVAYYLFSTTVPGGRVPELVRFNNPYGGANPPGLTTQLLYRRGNHGWHRTELGATGKTFCRSTPSESFDEFVVVIANGSTSSLTSQEFTRPLVQARATCGDWQGEVTAHRVLTTPAGDLTVDVTMEARAVRFTPAELEEPGGWRFRIAAGSVRSWAKGSRTGSLTCQFASPDTVTIALAPANGTLITGDPGDDAADAAQPFHTMHRGTGTVTPFSFTMDCVSGSTTQKIVAADVNDWFHTAAESGGTMPWTASTAPGVLQGTFTRVATGTGVTQTYTWTWRFERIRPPGW